MNLIEKVKIVGAANKQLAVNIFGMGGIRAVAIVISLCTTPAYLRYFSNQSILGLWLTVVSLAGSISAMDLGLGTGLRNKLTESFAAQRRDESVALISTSYALMSAIIVLMSLPALFLIKTADIGILFNDIAMIDVEQIRWILGTLIISVLIQMLLRLVNAVLYALQEAILVGLAELSTSISMLAFIIAMPSGSDMENLKTLTIFYSLVSNIPYVILNIYVFFKKGKWCRPRILACNWNASKIVLSLGLKFFYLTLMSMVSHNTNEALISAMVHPSAVVEYQIYNKMFTLISTVISVLMVPLWSAATKALAEKNYKWLDTTHRYLCGMSIIVLAGGLCVIPLIQPIINIWLGNESIAINPIMAVPFAIYIAEDTFNGANATIANGTNWIKCQMWMAPVGALLNFPLTWVLNETFHSWIVVVVANILSLLPIMIGQFVYIRKKLRLCMGDS